jgi:transforming growth factor-beta-induced protein
MRIKHAFLGLLAIATVFPALSLAEPKQRFKPGDETIAEIAVKDPGTFSTLVAALTCTGLVGAVADPEAELTVFAPTNAAFAETLGVTASTVCDIDSELLTTVLLYHVVGERRPSPSVVNGRNKEIMMLSGGYVFPVGKGSLDIVDSAGETVSIETPDVLASNGIVHVIDGVLLP